MDLKRALTIGVLCALLAAPFSVFAQQFYDVPDSYKHIQAITNLSDNGIISGYPDGSFRPEQTIARAEATKLLISSIKSPDFIQNAMEELAQSGVGAPFYDVDSGEWYTPYILLAKQYGVIQGYPDGSFKPGDKINFAEGLKMILESYGVDVSGEEYYENPLLFVQQGEWFAPYFAYSYNQNLINRDKFYHPAQRMTRGEFAEILYRLKTTKEGGLDEFPGFSEATSDEYTVTIPKLNIININVSFADPYNPSGALDLLKGGLGHYLAPPGDGHKMVLFGHSSGYNWDNSPYKYILTEIDQLQTGDLIYINYQEKGYAYQVKQKEIIPAEQMAPVMADYGYEELALYTCWPPNGISKRYVVYATPL